jgi:hypothetical protein
VPLGEKRREHSGLEPRTVIGGDLRGLPRGDALPGAMAPASATSGPFWFHT